MPEFNRDHIKESIERNQIEFKNRTLSKIRELERKIENLEYDISKIPEKEKNKTPEYQKELELSMRKIIEMGQEEINNLKLSLEG